MFNVINNFIEKAERTLDPFLYSLLDPATVDGLDRVDAYKRVYIEETDTFGCVAKTNTIGRCLLKEELQLLDIPDDLNIGQLVNLIERIRPLRPLYNTNRQLHALLQETDNVLKARLQELLSYWSEHINLLNVDFDPNWWPIPTTINFNEISVKTANKIIAQINFRLRLAISQKKDALVVKYIHAGANLHTLILDKETDLSTTQYLLENSTIDVNITNTNYQTPLMLSIKNGPYIGKMQFFIDHHANVLAKDIHGRSALTESLNYSAFKEYRESIRNQLQAIELLISNGCSLNLYDQIHVLFLKATANFAPQSQNFVQAFLHNLQNLFIPLDQNQSQKLLTSLKSILYNITGAASHITRLKYAENPSQELYDIAYTVFQEINTRIIVYSYFPYRFLQIYLNILTHPASKFRRTIDAILRDKSLYLALVLLPVVGYLLGRYTK
jgi:hypothetical protein